MKTFSSIIIMMAFAFALHSCGGAETKVDPNAGKENDTATSQADPVVTEKPADEKIPSAEPRSNNVDSQVTGERHEILRNIDKHLVSTQTASDRLTIENKLTDVDFQRVIIEVSELNASGQPSRTNFYQVVNLEAGTQKLVKITPPSQGAKVDIHIVKAKSTALTNGEMILVGSRYSPGS